MTLCSLPFTFLLVVVRRRRDMIAATPEKSLNAPEFAQNRRALLALTILNILIYALLIPIALVSSLPFVVFSVKIQINPVLK